MTAKIVIQFESLKGAQYLMQELERSYPLLDGRIEIVIPNEIKPLSEVIKEQK